MPTPPRPPGLLAAALFTAAQGALITALGAYLAVNGLVGHPRRIAEAELGGALALLAGVVLLLVARGLARRRRWSRSPALLAQILCLPVGWGLIQGDRYLLGVPLSAVALVTTVLLLLPASSAAFDG